MGVGPNWKHAEREDFEWVVEQLVIREHSDADATIRIPDDRGGDGGVDIMVDYPSRRIVYQLKFYTDGLSSNETTRKNQIKRSFTSAMDLTPRPSEWVLVVPCKYKDSIVDYVKNVLITRLDGEKPSFSMLDQPQLDAKLTEHPDLLDMFQRDDHFTKLVALHNAEQAVLTGGLPDVMARLTGLNRVIAAQDPNWTFGYSSHGGITTVTPVPKHPRASEVSPLGVRLGIDITQADEALASRFRERVGFGAPGSLVLPAEVIKDFTWLGPDFMRPIGELTELTIGESAAIKAYQGKAVRLSTVDGTGHVTAAHEGRISRCDSGIHGCSITAKFHRSIEITMLVPFTAGENGRATVSLSTSGCEPREVYRGIDLRNAVRSAARIEIHLDGEKLAVIGIDRPDGEDSDGAELAIIAEFARDLDRVQDRTGTIFVLPTEISDLERIWLRVFRIILDGGIAPIPRLAFEGQTHPNGGVQTGPGASLVMYGKADSTGKVPNTTVQLFGRPVRLTAPLAFFHPATTIDALGPRNAEGCIPFRMAGIDDTVFVAYLFDVVKTKTEITPWGLIDIDEPLVPQLPGALGA